MARIAQAEIESYKTNVDLVLLVENSGIELTQHGDNHSGLCCFHPDKNPSLIVSRSTNLFHCFGCGAAGSVIDWIMKREKVSFRHAIEILREQCSSLAANSLAAHIPSRYKPVLNLSADNQKLLNETVAYFNSHSAEVRPYLQSRGIDSEELIKHFVLGISNRTLGYHLPNKKLKAGKEIRSRLIEIGLLRESGHEVFRGSLVIPIFDEANNIVGIYGRKVTQNLREGTPLHMYLKGPHRGVWNWQGLVDNKEVILCEALIDALTIYKAGFENVTSSYGVNGFTQDHINALKRYGTKRLLIAYDRDDAGDRAAQELADRLSNENIECFRIEFPINTDANEYALLYHPTKDKWIELLEQARPINKVSLSFSITQPINEAQEIKDSDQQSTINEVESSSPLLNINIEVEHRGDDIIIKLGDRFYRIRNLQNNNSYGQLKVNLLCGRREQYYIDTIDLCLARQRKEFIKAAGEELGIKDEIIKRDLGKVLLKLEELQDELIRKTLTPSQPTITISELDRQAALALLRDPDLLKRVVEDFHRCGVVGEETNKLVGYLAAVSRKLEEPLAVIIQSSSAAGKTSLMEAVLEMIPTEERVKYSAMTGQSLFYLGNKDLKHKILAIVEQEGAQQAAYALKLLQSEGELTIASTGKDANTGRLITHEYRVEGPVMIFITTTAIEIDPELLNRCLVLTVNEGREQTRLIHQLQREKETLDGLWALDERKAIITLHQNAQRLLRPINVVNPYARALTFLDDQTRSRRDHTKYLKLIRSVALLHQYQRQIKVDSRNGESKQYIEVTIDDIEIANHLANEVLGRSLDELPPQTRRLLFLLDEMVKSKCKQLQIEQKDYRFTGRDVREHTAWSYDQVRVHIERLVELDYIIVHRGGRGQQFVYELLYDGRGRDGHPFLIGLIDVAQLRAKPSSMTSTLGGKEESLVGSLGSHLDVIGVSFGSSENGVSSSINEPFSTIDEEIDKNAYIGEEPYRRNHSHRIEEG
jgi:DNA primase